MNKVKTLHTIPSYPPLVTPGFLKGQKDASSSLLPPVALVSDSK